MNPFKPFNDAQMAFKRWLLNKLIPYIEGTKKEENREEE